MLNLVPSFPVRARFYVCLSETRVHVFVCGAFLPLKASFLFVNEGPLCAQLLSVL